MVLGVSRLCVSHHLGRESGWPPSPWGHCDPRGSVGRPRIRSWGRRGPSLGSSRLFSWAECESRSESSGSYRIVETRVVLPRRLGLHVRHPGEAGSWCGGSPELGPGQCTAVSAPKMSTGFERSMEKADAGGGLRVGGGAASGLPGPPALPPSVLQVGCDQVPGSLGARADRSLPRRSRGLRCQHRRAHRFSPAGVECVGPRGPSRLHGDAPAAPRGPEAQGQHVASKRACPAESET